MAALKQTYDAVHWFMRDLGARLVAESGIPSDMYHLGKIVLQSLRDAPDFVMQIDAATGKSETFRSVLERSVRCAESFNKLGLKEGDTVVLMAPNHLDLTIPFYAAFYIGVQIAPLDAFLTVVELEAMFKMNEAKMVFCQNERVPLVKEALKNLQLDATIVTFNDSDDCITFSNFLEKYGSDADIEKFRATDLDPADTIAMLVSTSGTTNLPKACSLTHKNIILSIPYLWTGHSKFPTPTRLALVSSPLQWLSAGFHFLFSPILRFTRLQNSATFTSEAFVDLVNKYKPSYTTISPPLLTMFTKPENVAKCDISCFECILLGGSVAPQELIQYFQKISPNTHLQGFYGLSEAGGMVIIEINPPLGSDGRLIGLFNFRLVSSDTKEDILEPHAKGELWLRGPSICKGYYNNPEMTKESFEDDGWLKTGDIFYRDEHNYFYFVERLKLLLKYKNHQVSPLELETVIRRHPGVLDVAVTGVQDEELNDLPVACVVPRTGHNVSAQEIKDLVKNSLSDPKQLRGGVIFLKALPMTASTKVHRRQLKEMALTMARE